MQISTGASKIYENIRFDLTKIMECEDNYRVPNVTPYFLNVIYFLIIANFFFLHFLIVLLQHFLSFFLSFSLSFFLYNHTFPLNSYEECEFYGYQRRVRGENESHIVEEMNRLQHRLNCTSAHKRIYLFGIYIHIIIYIRKRVKVRKLDNCLQIAIPEGLEII